MDEEQQKEESQQESSLEETSKKSTGSPGNKSNTSSLMIPGAIVVAGAIIAGAIVYTNMGATSANPTAGNGTGNSQQQDVNSNAISLPAPNEDDHIRGSLDATVTIVEYSDPECPFCKRFHGTMQTVLEQYDESEVAWVYRHFPIEQLHQKAFPEAVAIECAAQVGDNNTFWEYADILYENTPSNDGLNLAQLETFATDVGLNVSEFNQCRESDAAQQAVQADEDALIEGLPNSLRQRLGTPFSVVFVDGKPVDIISGALPIDQVTTKIDNQLN